MSDVLPSAVEWNPNHLRGAAWTREPVLTPVPTLTEAEGDPTLTGRCWFRRRTRCPFFAAGDDGIGAQERHAIYVACGDERTHRPPA